MYWGDVSVVFSKQYLTKGSIYHEIFPYWLVEFEDGTLKMSSLHYFLGSYFRQIISEAEKYFDATQRHENHLIDWNHPRYLKKMTGYG